jgi:PAS domain S-box-containing protein
MGEDFKEGEARLEPGDLLLVCSDGLAELDDRPVALEELAAGLEPAEGTAKALDRLLHRISGPLADDVTVVLLHRLASGSPSWLPHGSASWATVAADGAHPVHEELGRVVRAPSSRPIGPARGEAAAPRLVEEESPGRLFLRFLTIPGSSGGFYALLVMATLIVFGEWHLGTSSAGLDHPDAVTILLAFVGPAAVGFPWFALGVAVAVRSARIGIAPLPVLASRARQIAAGARVPIPYQDRENEVGDLARALREWQEAAAVREVLLRSAPVGICLLDATGAVLSSNEATWAILGYRGDELEGTMLVDLLHPGDHELADQVGQLLAVPGTDRATVEARLRRGDGSWLWCSAVVAPVAREGQEPDGFIVILEDVSERKRQAEWAVTVQREMLPNGPPPLVGYDLAGRCLAAQEVAGDLYDWVDTGDGHLQLTVADVMGKGKGMGAALVMAALRTALRAAPKELGPAERVARAAASMTFGAEAEGMFVTVFHGRLELATGRLRYVDAGHGYCLIRRAGGEVERLGQRSMPVGVGMGEVFREGVVELEAGDLLLVAATGWLGRTTGQSPWRSWLRGWTPRTGPPRRSTGSCAGSRDRSPTT